MSFAVAIDGPAAAGKGTISKAVAAHFGFAYLDTGLLYRAVGARVRDGAEPEAAARALERADLERDDLRMPEVSDFASKVAVIPQVRAALVDFQRAFAARAGGAVLDGRDIGTVICPAAAVKLFVTASPECRAERRFRELRGNGIEATPEGVLADVIARDRRDSERAEAPLRMAGDAVQINTSNMTIEAAVNRAIEIVNAARG